MGNNVSSFLDSLVSFFKTQSKVQIAEHTVVAIVIVSVLRTVAKEGIYKTFGKWLVSATRAIPLTNKLVNQTIKSEAKQTVEKEFEGKYGPYYTAITQLPAQGLDHETIIKRMNLLRQSDVQPEKGTAWAYVYDAGHDHTEFVTRAHNMYIHTNALSPLAFPSLRQMENEIVAMTKSLFGGDDKVVGSVSSGGTESLQLMLLTYRTRARALYPSFENFKPQVILCKTAHPAILKACHYFDLEPVLVDTNEDKSMNIQQVKDNINARTMLLIGSAPQYPHGVMDSIADLSEIALKHQLPLHVDSCIGGFVLPWAKKLGYDLPPFDFQLPGVTSISMDLHKYGYSCKGASVILYRDEELRKHQFFTYSQWPGGLFISPTLQGTRGGGPMAGAYASLLAMGENGFKNAAKQVMETAAFIRQSVNSIEGLHVIGNSKLSLLAFGSTDPKVNIFAVADAMETKGWKMERQPNPDCIHCTVMLQHVESSKRFVTDLETCLEIVKQNPESYKKGSVAMYGMVASIPDETLVDDFLLSFINRVYQI
jgi:sphinganine-1-phosphate aldolase